MSAFAKWPIRVSVVSNLAKLDFVVNSVDFSDCKKEFKARIVIYDEISFIRSVPPEHRPCMKEKSYTRPIYFSVAVTKRISEILIPENEESYWNHLSDIIRNKTI